MAKPQKEISSGFSESGAVNVVFLHLLRRCTPRLFCPYKHLPDSLLNVQSQNQNKQKNQGFKEMYGLSWLRVVWKPFFFLFYCLTVVLVFSRFWGSFQFCDCEWLFATRPLILQVRKSLLGKVAFLKCGVLSWKSGKKPVSSIFSSPYLVQVAFFSHQAAFLRERKHVNVT